MEVADEENVGPEPMFLPTLPPCLSKVTNRCMEPLIRWREQRGPGPRGRLDAIGLA